MSKAPLSAIPPIASRRQPRGRKCFRPGGNAFSDNVAWSLDFADLLVLTWYRGTETVFISSALVGLKIRYVREMRKRLQRSSEWDIYNARKRPLMRCKTKILKGHDDVVPKRELKYHEGQWVTWSWWEASNERGSDSWYSIVELNSSPLRIVLCRARVEIPSMTHRFNWRMINTNSWYHNPCQ